MRKMIPTELTLALCLLLTLMCAACAATDPLEPPSQPFVTLQIYDINWSNEHRSWKAYGTVFNRSQNTYRFWSWPEHWGFPEGEDPDLILLPYNTSTIEMVVDGNWQLVGPFGHKAALPDELLAGASRPVLVEIPSEHFEPGSIVRVDMGQGVVSNMIVLPRPTDEE